MASYLLDTNVIIDVLNDKRDRQSLLTNLLAQGHLLACCSINVTEVYAGMRSNEESRTRQLLESFQYLPVTLPIARLAGTLKRDYSKRGKTMNIADATIAAVALHYETPLITQNVKDFPMKELQLYPL